MITLALLLLAAPPPAWQEVGKGEHCKVYNRAKPGSDVKEVLAVGTFDAPVESVHAVLDDLGAYQEFMPSSNARVTSCGATSASTRPW